jgi:hypothetical protein
MGDTCNSDMLAPIAMDADVIIHEATNAWIKDQVTFPPLRFPSFLRLTVCLLTVLIQQPSASWAVSPSVSQATVLTARPSVLIRIHCHSTSSFLRS